MPFRRRAEPRAAKPAAGVGAIACARRQCLGHPCGDRRGRWSGCACGRSAFSHATVIRGQRGWRTSSRGRRGHADWCCGRGPSAWTSVSWPTRSSNAGPARPLRCRRVGRRSCQAPPPGAAAVAARPGGRSSLRPQPRGHIPDAHLALTARPCAGADDALPCGMPTLSRASMRARAAVHAVRRWATPRRVPRSRLRQLGRFRRRGTVSARRDHADPALANDMGVVQLRRRAASRSVPRGARSNDADLFFFRIRALDRPRVSAGGGGAARAAQPGGRGAHYVGAALRWGSGDESARRIWRAGSRRSAVSTPAPPIRCRVVGAPEDGHRCGSRGERDQRAGQREQRDWCRSAHQRPAVSGRAWRRAGRAAARGVPVAVRGEAHLLIGRILLHASRAAARCSPRTTTSCARWRACAPACATTTWPRASTEPRARKRRRSSRRSPETQRQPLFSPTCRRRERVKIVLR